MAVNESEEDVATTTGAGANPTTDLLLAGVFISGAALLTAIRDPIFFGFTPQPVLTLALDSVAIALLWLGVVLRRRALFLLAGGLLLALLALKLVSQPADLGLPMAVIWPLRLLVVMIVGFCWALLAQPPDWLRRAIFAIGVASLVALAFWGGPAIGSTLFGWNVPSPITNFVPFQLAIDSQGTVYASDFNSGLVWVFNNSGSPAGTLHPAIAPQPPTPGPGILPNGMEEELLRSGVSGAPTPVPGGPSLDPEAAPGALPDLCGIAVDAQDNLYTLPATGVAPFQISRFDRNGNISARFALPADYVPWYGCLAVDDAHIYVSSQLGRIYIMDLQGNLQRQAKAPFQPSGIALSQGKLLVLAPNSLSTVDVNTGTVTNNVFRAALQQVFVGIVAAPNGEVLIVDGLNTRILRVNPVTWQINGYFGEAGDAPGQFRNISGMAFDKAGRLFVADSNHRVIQRFNLAGSVDAIWWAARNLPVSNGPAGGAR